MSSTNPTSRSMWPAIISACWSSETKSSPPGRPWWAISTTRWPASASSCTVWAWRLNRRLSWTSPSSTGELRSRRMTRRCSVSRSSIVLNEDIRICVWLLSKSCWIRFGTVPNTEVSARVDLGVGDVLGDVEHPVREAVLVVVPRQDLDEAAFATDDVRGVEVGVGRERQADDIRGDDLVVGVAQHARQRAAVGGITESVVDVFGAHVGREVEDQFGQRSVRDRDTDRHPVHLALELWEDLGGGLCGTRRGGDDVFGGRAATSLFGFRGVDQRLAARVGVDGRQRRGVDAELLVEDVCDRRDAVGRTGGVRDDVLAVVLVVVDAVDQRLDGFFAFRRRGDDDLVGTGFEVEARVLFGPEDTGTLEGHVDVEVAPRQLAGALDVVQRDRGAADGQLVVFEFEAVEAAHDGVVLGEVLHVLEVHYVVDACEFEPRVLLDRAEHAPTDSTESVESDTDNLVFVDLLTSIQIGFTHMRIALLQLLKIGRKHSMKNILSRRFA